LKGIGSDGLRGGGQRDIPLYVPFSGAQSLARARRNIERMVWQKSRVG
jgi:hypothetical protein